MFRNSNNNNELDQSNKIYNFERCQMKLSLRKKKLDEKIFNQRKIEMQNFYQQKNNYDKFINDNNSFNNLILKIRLEFNDEHKILQLLSQILYIIEQNYL